MNKRSKAPTCIANGIEELKGIEAESAAAYVRQVLPGPGPRDQRPRASLPRVRVRLRVAPPRGTGDIIYSGATGGQCRGRPVLEAILPSSFSLLHMQQHLPTANPLPTRRFNFHDL